MTKHYKNWIVLGPVRTGTRAVFDSLISHRPFNLSIRVGTDAEPRDLNEHEIVHAHNLQWLEFATENTGVIICVRNPIYSALSWCIVPKFGLDNGALICHFRGDNPNYKRISENIRPSYVDLNQFQQAVESAEQFYGLILEQDLVKTYPIVEYEHWSDDPRKILNYLGIPSFDPWYHGIKSPGSPEQWIKNFDEIIEHGNRLSLENFNQICQRKRGIRRYIYVGRKFLTTDLNHNLKELS